MPPAFSVVIPTLDEEARIAGTLEAAGAALGPGAELLVADGGSRDRTVEIARALGARIVTARGGRGAQLAAGADVARGETLVFLHADTRLPAGAGDAIAAVLADARVAGGAFALAFDPAERPSAMLRMLARGITLRSRLLRTATGDQAIFARADALRRAGGVPPLPLFEDVRLFRALRRVGRVRILRAAVATSPRLWQRHGTVRVVLLHLGFRALHAAGVSPFRLARWYRR